MEGLEQLFRTSRRPAPTRTHLLDRSERLQLVKVKLMRNESVGMLHLNVELSQVGLREIVEVEGHDRIRVAHDCRGENMSIIWVRKHQGCHQWLVTSHQAVRDRRIHPFHNRRKTI